MRNQKGPAKTYIYRAPLIYAGLFYLILLAWTVFSVSIMGAKGWVNWLQLFMVAFIFVMTWYFSWDILQGRNKRGWEVRVDELQEGRQDPFHKDSHRGGSLPAPRIHPVSAGAGKGLPFRRPQKQGPSGGPFRHP